MTHFIPPKRWEMITLQQSQHENKINMTSQNKQLRKIKNTHKLR